MPTFRSQSRLPVMKGNLEIDLQELRTAFYLLEEELRYMFNNLDSDNLSERLSVSINDAVARLSTDMSLDLDTAGILSTVMDDLNKQGTEIRQMVDSVTIKYYDSAGNETTFKLSDGALDLSFLKGQIDDAEKVATNFISLTGNDGIEVGNKLGGSWSGYRTQMLADRFCIVDENNNELASYEANAIHLGKSENKDTVIDFNNGMVTLSYDAQNDRAAMEQNSIYIFSETGEEVAIASSRYDAKTGVMKGSQVSCRENGLWLTGSEGDQYSIDTYTKVYLGSTTSSWMAYGLENSRPVSAGIELSVSGFNIRGNITTSDPITIDPGSTTYTPFISKRIIDGSTCQADFGVGNPAVGEASAQIRLWNSSGTQLNAFMLRDGHADLQRGYFLAAGFRVPYADSSNNRYFTAENDTYSLSFGIGASGVNRGIWDNNRGDWTFYNDKNDVYIQSPRYIFLNLYSSSGDGFLTYGVASSKPAFYPHTNNNGYVGTSTYRFTTFYSVNAVNVSSDRRLKKDISYDLDRAEQIFDGLRPAQYRYNHTDDEDLHFGFIAQDVIETLHACDYDVNNMALVSSGEYLGMTYQELDALIVYKLQKMAKEFAELKTELRMKGIT